MKRVCIMLAVVLTLGLAFTSCWTTGSVNEPTQFEGRWIDLIALNEWGFTDLSYTFTGFTYVLKILSNEGYVTDYTISGTIRFTKDRIQFASEKQRWTVPYTLTGSDLRLEMSKTPPPAVGTFVKQ